MLVKQPSGIGDSLHMHEWNIPTHAKRTSAPGACGSSVLGEISSDSAPGDPHVLSPVRQYHLPHPISLLTASPGGPETHCEVSHMKLFN